jgi:small-conductance mechanosensitive channel
LFIILSIWQVDITPLLASAGILGLAVAFAAKETLANFFGGISIFFDKPYKIGDYVNLESGERGEVVLIGIRSTRIKTRDDILITIPNSLMANMTIINESAPKQKLRIRIPFGVAYGTDVDQVEEVVMGIAESNRMVVKDPDPRVRFRRFGDSALEFELLCWGNQPAERGLLIHQLNRAIYKRFAEEGIQIPFPQRDLHIYRNEDGIDS